MTTTCLLTEWRMFPTVKTCFKCGETLPLEAFYKHARMADGRLNKCKACTRADVKANREANRDYYVLYDRIRSAEPHRIEARRAYGKSPRGRKLAAIKREEWRKRNTDKAKAHRLVKYALATGRLKVKPCEVCGAKAVAHHDDYTKPLVVRWLCGKHHAEHHRIERWHQEGVLAP